MRIWKFPIDQENQSVEMPPGSKILTAQIQHGYIQLWALCDDRVQGKELRHIAVYGTGNPLPDAPGEHLSTVQLTSGIVAHVFEVNRPSGGQIS